MADEAAAVLLANPDNQPMAKWAVDKIEEFTKPFDHASGFVVNADSTATKLTLTIEFSDKVKPNG